MAMAGMMNVEFKMVLEMGQFTPRRRVVVKAEAVVTGAVVGGADSSILIVKVTERGQELPLENLTEEEQIQLEEEAMETYLLCIIEESKRETEQE